jgi:hypothetical protein
VEVRREVFVFGARRQVSGVALLVFLGTVAALLAALALTSGRADGPGAAILEDSSQQAALPLTGATPGATPNLTLLGHMDFGGEGHTGNVAALGQYAFVGSWYFGQTCPALGVRIVDLADPSNPRWVATTARYDGTSAEHVVVRAVETPDFRGTLLAVGIQRCGPRHLGAPAGVALVDVTVPTHPRELGFFDLGPGIGGVHELDLAVRGPQVLALLAVPYSENARGIGDFQILDVSDPRTPVRLFAWGVVAQLGIREGIGCYHTNYAHSARSSADGQRAYVSYWDAGVFIFDISDPVAPRLEGRVLDTSFDGNFHSADETTDGYLLTAEESGFRARAPSLQVGARNGTSELELFACEASAENRLPSTHALSGPLIDLGDGCTAVTPVPGSIALADESLGRCSLAQKTVQARASGAEALLVSRAQDPATLQDGNGRALLFDQSSDLVVPVVAVGRRDGQRLRSLGASGRTVLTLPSTRPSGGLRIWDIRQPDNPVLLSVFRTPNAEDYPKDAVGGYTIHNLLAIGNRVLASWYSDGVRLLDLSDPREPREVATFVPPATPDPEGRQPTVPLVWGVAHTGSLVLASDINGGLYVLRLEGLTLE